MWRVGTAALLLLLLVVLVADMLFGGGSAPHRAGGELVYHPALPTPSSPLLGQPPLVVVPATPRDDAAGLGSGDAAGRGRDGRPLSSEAPASPVTGSSEGQSVAALNAGVLDRLPAAPRDVNLDTWPGYPPVGYAPDAEETEPTTPALPVQVEPASPSPAPHQPRPGAAAKPKAAYDPKLAEVQRKLAALGYAPGPVDGLQGKRTEIAIRTFQKDKGLQSDGRIDDRLIARLESELARGAQLRQQELEAMGPEAPLKTEKPKDRGLFGAVLGGFQRLLGHDLNSVERPDEMTAYCRANTDTWIYDFGREAFVYCGNIVAGTSRTAVATEGSTTR